MTPLDTLQSIRSRRTLKVLSNQPLATKPCDHQLINTLIESAYYAPYHYPCTAEHQTQLSSALPWRFYVLDSGQCRQLARYLQRHDLAVGKLIQMLNSADYLIQATWCPTPNKKPDNSHFEDSLINMEHLAGAGAAIQNLLLTATALGHENYWGSGGSLREDFAFDLLGIPKQEILLGSLFIFPNENEVPSHVQLSTSKRRDRRGSLDSNYRLVTFSQSLDT